nr:MAG TPA: hypothetical protein [Caudoviricetes sp.]
MGNNLNYCNVYLFGWVASLLGTGQAVPQQMSS